MRDLNEYLLEAQKLAPLIADISWAGTPAPRLRITNQRCGVMLAEFTRWYSGSEAQRGHAACVPGDGSLIRLRLDASNNLYFQRVTSPGSGSTYSSWADWSVTAYAVAICACVAAVYAFRLGTDGHVYRRQSSDNGATWGSWTDMGDVGGASGNPIAACFKDADEAIVAVAANPNISQDSYKTGDDGYCDCYAERWRAQTFTPAATFAITKVSLKMFREGSPGTVTVSIRATDGEGKPTGGDLASGTINGNTLTTDSAGEWYDITLSSYTLTGGTKYAIVVRATSGNASNLLHWLRDESSPSYTGGSHAHSADSGATWTLNTAYDYMFEVFGGGLGVYTSKLSGGSWGAFTKWTKSTSFNSYSGLAVCYQADWLFIITGVNSDSEDGVWDCVFGDGNLQAVGVWGTPYEVIKREASEAYQYTAPFIAYPDVFRVFFVEKYTGTTAVSRVFWTHGQAGEEFGSGYWKEPIPYNYTSDYGLAICFLSTDLYLCAPDAVYYADLTLVTTDITSDVVEISEKLHEGNYRSKLTIVLDNTSGKYNGFGKKGYQANVEWGYKTTDGYKYSTAPAFWITGWEFVSPPWFPLRAFWPQGVLGTLKIYCESGWELLERWRAQRKYEWALDDKNFFQILRWILARAGFGLMNYSDETALTDYYPEFEVPAGYNGKWAIKKLLGYVETVMRFADDYAVFVLPQADDEATYVYHSTWQHSWNDPVEGLQIDHLVYRGNYGTGAWDPNRAIVETDTVRYEGNEWDEIARHHDRLVRVTTPNYASASDASRRVLRELRHGEVFHSVTGWMQAPTNCGQETYDVVKVTDIAGGVTNLLVRILGIETNYNLLQRVYWQKFTLGAL